MILSQLIEIAGIDLEISQLHERLTSLYAQRAEICASSSRVKNGFGATTTRSSLAADETIDLEGINLSLLD